MDAPDPRNLPVNERLRLVMNALAAAKASAQLLERRLGDVPDETRAFRLERLRVISDAIDVAAALLRDETAPTRHPSRDRAGASRQP